jgi:hypothetical protein
MFHEKRSVIHDAKKYTCFMEPISTTVFRKLPNFLMLKQLSSVFIFVLFKSLNSR